MTSGRPVDGDRGGPEDDRPAFQSVQMDFAAYIRHPDLNPMPPGIEKRRMRIYARLFYNNIESILAKTFSVFREVAGDEPWHAMVRDFVHRHRAESPYYAQVPEEFMEYLDTCRGEASTTTDEGRPMTSRADPALLPFALELCHYEWVRMALDRAPDADCAFDDEPVTIDDALALSPLAWPLCYAYAVQDIGPDFLPEEPAAAPTWLIACRNRHDEVTFTKSNAVTTRLLNLLGEADTRGAFKTLADELGSASEAVERTGLATLNRLHEQDIVVRI